MRIELVYEKTCPNVEAARQQLRQAFAELAARAHWQEWEVSNPDAPPHVHGYGSPTILVNGRDVCGDTADGDDYCCRVYSHGENSNKGVPPVADIVAAIKTSQRKQTDSPRWQLNGALLPAVGIAFVPKLACPACWPAYAGLLSSLGIGFIDYTPYLLPLTTLFVFVAVSALAYRAHQRRGYAPLILGLAAGAILLSGKFQFDSDAAMYTGLALLVLASLWNTWPKTQIGNSGCPPCETESQETVRRILRLRRSS